MSIDGPIDSPTEVTSDEMLEPPSSSGRSRTIRDLALASIGIAGVLGDEGPALYRRSVEQGVSTLQKARERLRLAREQALEGAHSRAIDGYEAALARLNVATGADIDSLTHQVAELEAKIDKLIP